MPGFNPQLLPFSQPGMPPNPALYAPAPPTDQSQTTASILSALARSLFDPTSGGAGAAAAQPIAPTAVTGGTLPGEMRVDPNVLYPPGGAPLRGEMHIPQNILNPSGGAPGPVPSGTSPPMGPSSGGPPLPPPMLRPGSDMGAPAPDGADTGGVLQTALSVAQGAQNDPGITKSVINDLMTMGGDPEQNKWLALAKAGFAMAASKNPSILGAAGEGAEAGLSDYLKSRQETLQNRYTAAQLQQSAQDHAATIASQQQTQALAQKEFEEKVSEYQHDMPLNDAIKKAQAEMYASHGDYFGAKAVAPAGGGGANPGDTALMHYNAALSTNMKLYLSSLDPAAAMQPGNIEQARAWAVANTPRPGSVQAPGGTVQPTAVAQGAPAVGAMPAGAVQAAPPGTPDGKTGGGGKYVVRGGFYYPVGQ